MAEQTGGRSGAKFPQYCIVADRLKTFRNWPSNNHQQPKELAEAGFFFQGDGDIVTCFSCGVVLSRWTPEDDVWEEHEKFQSTCEHVLQHRLGGMNLGSSDVNKVAQGNSVEASGGDSIKQHSDSKSIKQHSEDPIQKEKDTSRERNHETIEEELQRLRRQFICKTCFKEKACMVILPCTHLSACPICIEKLQNCNVCQQHITATVKAYCA